MFTNASEFMQALANNREAVGFISGRALGDVLQAQGSVHGRDGVLRVRLPYHPGRKDRQLAAVLLQALGQPQLTQGIATARAWKMIAGQVKEYGCQLVVIENADLLDRDGLAYLHSGYLPAVILMGGERLAQRIARNTDYAERILRWGAA